MNHRSLWLRILIAALLASMELGGFLRLQTILLHRSVPLTSMRGLMYLETYLAVCAAGLCFVLAPVALAAAEKLRTRWRTAYSVVGLAVLCAGMAVWVHHFGNHQFGSWDEGILIDTGWRQMLGQHPYSSFVTPHPVGFCLGAYYAFRIFGVNWNAMLYLTALLAIVGFLWTCWLLKQLTERRIVALAGALVVTLIVTLQVSFWWYNSVSETFVIVFLLSSLLLLRKPESVAANASFLFALLPLALMKPNMAGLAGVGCVALLLATGPRVRVLLYSASAVAFTLLFLHFNHVSVGAMWSCYHAAAIERGLGHFGLRDYDRRNRLVLLLWLLPVGLPLLGAIRGLRQSFTHRRWNEAAQRLFVPYLALLGLYGIVSNNDLKSLEYLYLLLAAVLLAWGKGMPERSAGFRRYVAALLCAFAVTGLYSTLIRERILGIGMHDFYEEKNANLPVVDPFFADMRASQRMDTVVQSLHRAVAENGGPYFFGPRIEMGYALTQHTSPDGLWISWEPGTTIARSAQTTMVERWKIRRFETLVFLKETDGHYETIFYPQQFLDIIQSGYARDDSYPGLTVFHARAMQPNP